MSQNVSALQAQLLSLYARRDAIELQDTLLNNQYEKIEKKASEQSEAATKFDDKYDDGYDKLDSGNSDNTKTLRVKGKVFRPCTGAALDAMASSYAHAKVPQYNENTLVYYEGLDISMDMMVKQLDTELEMLDSEIQDLEQRKDTAAKDTGSGSGGG